MSGCLSLPFRILGCLGLLVLLAAGWLYRDVIIDQVRSWRHQGDVRESVGHPSERGVRSARDKVDSLNGWRADSVVLTATEMASLIGAGLDARFRSQVDSLTLRLGDGRIQVEGSIRTAGLPRDQLGPLGDMVGDRVHLSAAGTVTMAGPGTAEWNLDRLILGSFPFPKDVIPRLLESVTGSRSRALTVSLPAGVRGIQVRPGGVTIKGGAPSQ